jgi:hypothetical protein
MSRIIKFTEVGVIKSGIFKFSNPLTFSYNYISRVTGRHMTVILM